MNADAGPDVDPGWAPALSKLLIVFMIPWLIMSKRSRRAEPDPLIALRFSFLGFLFSPFLFAFGLFFITASAHHRTVPARLEWIAIGAASLGIGLTLVVRRRPLDLASPTALANSYRTRMFIGLAASEWPALLGFALALIYGRFWLYPPAAIGTVVGFVLVAPGRRDLDRQQAAVTARGSPLFIRQALRGHPTRDRQVPGIGGGPGLG